jgi:hypothetical protein
VITAAQRRAGRRPSESVSGPYTMPARQPPMYKDAVLSPMVTSFKEK